MALYHSVKGPVNYTVVGTPIIVDGVVSGFSAYPNPACLSLPETADFSKPFHIHSEFTPTLTNFGVVVGKPGLLKSGVYLQGIYSNYCRFAIYNSSSNTALLDQNIAYDSAVVTGNKHALDIIYNGTDTYNIKLENMVSSAVLVDSSITTTEKVGSNAGFTLGATKSDTYYVSFQGSIDLNSTYITVNGQPWFGMGPVEVKKVVINRPLPSGYTQVEYLNIATAGVYFSTGINATVDTDMGITASNITSDSAQLLVAQCRTGANQDYFRIAKAGASQRIIGTFGTSAVTDNNTTGVNKFTARINKSGLYVNGSLIGTFSNIPSSFTGIGMLEIFRGKYTNDIYYAYAGSRFYSAFVDDNVFLPCRRNSDNRLGIYNTKTGEFILPSGTGTFVAGDDVVPSTIPTDVNYVVKDGKLVFADSGLYLSGPTTYITEGSPTIVENVASGFSRTNAIKTTNTVPDLSQGFDVKVRFTTGSSFSEEWIMTPSGSDVDFSLTMFPSSTHFVFYYKILGSRGYRFSNFELQANTTYDFIAHSDGSTIEWTLGTPGNPISQTTISCDFSDFDLTRYIYFGSRLDGYFFTGSIDFNETYIKANGQLWFYGKNYASQNIAPVPSGYNCVAGNVGYTVVGTPTIVDGVVSGFSNSNYLTIASNTIDLSNFSVRLRFTANVLDGSEQILFQIGASGSAIPLGFRIHSNNKIVCYHSGTNSNQTYSFANTTLEQGKTYDVEFGAVNSVRYFKCGLADNMTDQAISSGSDSDFAGSVTRATYYGFALYSSSSQASKCSIDINNVYINIDGQLWFSGKGYAPSIGYIDMRTQAFTAAPSGATIGRDE